VKVANPNLAKNDGKVLPETPGGEATESFEETMRRIREQQAVIFKREDEDHQTTPIPNQTEESKMPPKT